MPQFAKRLAHPAAPRTPTKSPVSVPAYLSRHLPQGDGVVYDNGPVNGQVDAWTINFGFAASETIQVNSPVTGIQFWAWLEPGDTITSVEVQIGSTGYFSNDLFDGTVPLTQSNYCFTNNFGLDVCLVSGSFTGPTLSGNDWITLANASTVEGQPVYWDENSGVGCQSPGCPSLAQENTIGTIPSESFSMLGSNSLPPECFQSQGNLQIIANFTQQQGPYPGTSGVVIDHAGNLYGTTYTGGDNSAGFAYKLADFAGWLLDPLFSFVGGNSGDQPTGAILGPNGTLYGGAQGGIQNCGTDGSQYCGLVFNLTPQPKACRNALCPWDENVPYRFSSESDGSGVINVSASGQQGNLYGTTDAGGTSDAGTVFELTPSGGGWTKTTLYSFTGSNDGGNPSQVLVGNDGNLYGVTNGGGYGNGVVFQLTPSGGQWTETILHAFQYYVDGYDPVHLVQDSAGNLYGAVSIPETALLGTIPAIFVLQKTGSGWAFSENTVAHCRGVGNQGGAVNNLVIDAAGKIYGTGFDSVRGTSRSPDPPYCYSSYIFKASYDSNGWHYQDLDFLPNTLFETSGSLALDSSGNLYGTTSDCGTNNSGTVWQLSP
jgi:uncharacterized repeat protein (TIGR03803 family)